jgi:hypothetical protein
MRPDLPVMREWQAQNVLTARAFSWKLTSRMAAIPPDRPSALADRTAVLARKGALAPLPDGSALAGSAPPCTSDVVATGGSGGMA